MKTVLTTLFLTMILQDGPLIDLASNPAVYGRLRAVRVSGTGTVTTHVPTPKRQSALEVELESITKDGNSKSKYIAQILIRNTGPREFAFPIGRDGDATLRPANHGRREATFFLVPDVAKGTTPASGGALFATEDEPRTILRIPPLGVVRVRYPIVIDDTWLASEELNERPFRVRARVSILAYEDTPDEYHVHNPPPAVESKNALPLPQ